MSAETHIASRIVGFVDEGIATFETALTAFNAMLARVGSDHPARRNLEEAIYSAKMARHQVKDFATNLERAARR